MSLRRETFWREQTGDDKVIEPYLTLFDAVVEIVA
jgi:hypothetical protein